MGSYEEYLKRLHAEANDAYAIAEIARSKGFDPKNHVEIPKAKDLADRTQKLLDFLHKRNTAEQIRTLTKDFDGNRERVAIEIARIVCAESYLYGTLMDCPDCGGEGIKKKGNWESPCYECEGIGNKLGFANKIDTDFKETMKVFESKKGNLWQPDTPSQRLTEMAIYHGMCAGLAVLTEGILVAPLEGVVSARILKNKDNTYCLAASFAGPIRSAGGTGQALSVLIADIIRRDFDLVNPIMSFEEVERYKEETGAYARGLQHRPSNPEIETIVKSCPIYIDGEGVGNEVTGQRDLPRVRTNKVREGMLLVVCEGLVLKAPKILKYVDALKLDGWDWLRPFAKGSKTGGDNSVKPNKKYISDVLAGRPVFSQPMEVGGFRLRYGRSRLAGLATTSVHPASMKALAGFIVIGTQMKYERPGKGTVATPCDSIDGPYVEFKDGSAKMIVDYDELPMRYPTDPDYDIETIWDLGELLVPVGEFLENNHVLLESPYVPEWHKQVLEEKGIDYPKNFSQAANHVKNESVSLAPDYVGFYSDITDEEFETLINNLDKFGNLGNEEARIVCYKLGINVRVVPNGFQVYGDRSRPAIEWADLYRNKEKTDKKSDFLAHFKIQPRVTYRIGTRMGKPEGSKMREMKPPIHTMFVVGHKVGNKRLVSDASKRDDAIQVGIRYCSKCGDFTTKGVCPKDGENTLFQSHEWVSPTNDYKELYHEISPNKLWENALKQIKETEERMGIEEVFGQENKHKKIAINPDVKGVKGMTSKDKMNENLIKGILRHKNDISTFRDGTMRFDMVDITMTHFKPKEIGITAQQARDLGYDCDNENQVLELMPQDVVVPLNCATHLLNTTKFVDDMLMSLYSMDSFYNCEKIEDLVGHLIMGIAPHTSGSILARIIGFCDVKGHYGHPYFHAAKRRNCDGDIDAIIMLMDGLINFSRSFLSAHRGGLMDAPLILTMTIEPTEIDKEALNVDTMWNYPVSFYEGTMNRPSAKEATKSLGVETVEVRLEKGLNAFEGFGYTHETTDACEGPKENPYTALDSMKQKTYMQFELGAKIRAVDNKDQAGRLINRHLIRDMRGNLRAYGQQKVRCTKCGSSYRRVPIAGKCIEVIEKDAENPMTGEIEDRICNHKLILTVHQGSVEKYDGLIDSIIEKYGVDDYTDNLFRLVHNWVQDTFSKGDESIQQKLFEND